jgi:hypothetical protein
MGENHTLSFDFFSISFSLSSSAYIQEKKEENRLDWWW